MLGVAVPDGYKKKANTNKKKRDKQDSFGKGKIEALVVEVVKAAATEAEAAAEAKAARILWKKRLWKRQWSGGRFGGKGGCGTS